MIKKGFYKLITAFLVFGRDSHFSQSGGLFGVLFNGPAAFSPFCVVNNVVDVKFLSETCAPTIF